MLLHRKERCKRNKPYDGTVKLTSYYNSKGVNVPVKSTQITKVLQLHAALLQHETGVDPNKYTARSLHVGSAMAQLLGGCNDMVIKLQCRWHSDIMMEYLHQLALPVFNQIASTVFNQIASKMFANEGHSFSQNSLVTVH